jgi:hypothetical protein
LRRPLSKRGVEVLAQDRLDDGRVGPGVVAAPVEDPAPAPVLDGGGLGHPFALVPLPPNSLPASISSAIRWRAWK